MKTAPEYPWGGCLLRLITSGDNRPGAQGKLTLRARLHIPVSFRAVPERHDSMVRDTHRRSNAIFAHLLPGQSHMVGAHPLDLCRPAVVAHCEPAGDQRAAAGPGRVERAEHCGERVSSPRRACRPVRQIDPSCMPELIVGNPAEAAPDWADIVGWRTTSGVITGRAPALYRITGHYPIVSPAGRRSRTRPPDSSAR